MIIVVVTIHSKNFEALKLFENSVSKIMQKHGGKMLYAFETKNKNEEIHIIEFPNDEKLKNYQEDNEHKKYLDLKKIAIDNIDITISTTYKQYD